jgi:hypothetical protein
MNSTPRQLKCADCGQRRLCYLGGSERQPVWLCDVCYWVAKPRTHDEAMDEAQGLMPSG